MRRARKGVTLIELMVVLVILSLMSGITAMALRTTKPDVSSSADRIAAARREAIARGAPVHVLLHERDQTRMVTAFPDGRVIGAHVVPQDSADHEPTDVAR